MLMYAYVSINIVQRMACPSAHGPGVMFFRIAVQAVRTLLIAADKDAVIQHTISQPLRILMRGQFGDRKFLYVKRII